MNRFLRGSTSLGLGWIAMLAAPVHGQAPAPPPATAPSPVRGTPSGDLDSLTAQMTERVKEMAGKIETDLARTQNGPTLLRDAREMAQALDEFRRELPGLQNALRRRQVYAGIDASWHHLLAQIDRVKESPGLTEAARKAAEVDAKIHTAIGSNPYPPIYYGSQASPQGMAEILRLAHALVDRAEVLLAYVRADVPGPLGMRLAEEVTSVVVTADIFHDGINLDARSDDLARNGFAGVEAASDQVDVDLKNLAGRIRISDRVRSAWRSYRTTENLLRQSLKLPAPAAEPIVNPVAVDGKSPVLGLSNQLVEQVDQFLVTFTPEAKDVPEGGDFIADARRLRAAAAGFREEVPRAIDVSELAFAYRDVDAYWQRLARRTNRINQRRNGPIVQQIQGIWSTVAQIHSLLGMPGFPTEIEVY